MDCFELQSSLLLQIEKAEHSALLKVPFTCMIPIISYTCEVPFNKDSTTDMRCAVASNVFLGFQCSLSVLQMTSMIRMGLIGSGSIYGSYNGVSKWGAMLWP